MLKIHLHTIYYTKSSQKPAYSCAKFETNNNKYGGHLQMKNSLVHSGILM